jgi:hypothetical protein
MATDDERQHGIAKLEAEVASLRSDVARFKAAEIHKRLAARAVGYRSRYKDSQEINANDNSVTIINYSQPIYDMMAGAVTTRSGWRFTANEPGIYSVSAYAAFSLGNAVSEIREVRPVFG